MTHSQDSSECPNPSGLCMCGCGQPTPIARKTRRRFGHIAGEPIRFVSGHHNRVFGNARRIVGIVSGDYNVDPDTECWLWQGTKDRNGYGLVNRDSSPEHVAHRYVYRELRGPIADGIELHHRCPSGPNPSCVNPDHLDPLTKLEHMTTDGRLAALKSAAEARGWISPRSTKLSREKAAEIRRLLATHSGAELARRFGVSRSTISMIRLNQTWPE